jgi:hypothetical protein
MQEQLLGFKLKFNDSHEANSQRATHTCLCPSLPAGWARAERGAPGVGMGWVAVTAPVDRTEGDARGAF